MLSAVLKCTVIMNALVSEMKALLVLIKYFRHINNMFEIISAEFTCKQTITFKV